MIAAWHKFIAQMSAESVPENITHHLLHNDKHQDSTKTVQSSSSKLQHVVDGIIDFTAGTMAGITCVYVGQPLDTVKVKMQTFPGMYPTGIQCFVNTLKKEGISRGLYAGSVPALAANIAENSVLFLAYGFCQKFVASLLQRPVSELNAVHNACAGSLAAVAATFVLCPTELVKCRLQAMREMRTTATGSLAGSAAHIGPWSLTRQIIRDDGFRGLFRGLVPTAAREVPGYFCFFGAYEISRFLLTPAGKTKDDLSAIATCFCGGIGGISLWTAVFPADVVKSRVQVQGSGAFVPTLQKILREEGFRALYKGLGPALVRTFIASGALFVAYEATRKTLHGVIDDKLI